MVFKSTIINKKFHIFLSPIITMQEIRAILFLLFKQLFKYVIYWTFHIRCLPFRTALLLYLNLYFASNSMSWDFSVLLYILWMHGLMPFKVETSIWSQLKAFLFNALGHVALKTLRKQWLGSEVTKWLISYSTILHPSALPTVVRPILITVPFTI